MEINLPRHIINDVERRWAKKLEQAASEWKNRQKPRVTIPRTATAGRCHGIPSSSVAGVVANGKREGRLPD